MSELPPQPIAYEAQQAKDADDSHLNTLAICNWIWGGLVALFGFFGIFYIGLGVAMLNGSIPMSVPTTQGVNTNLNAFMGWYMIAMGVILGVVCWTAGILSIMTGFALRGRRRWLLCVVTSSLNCLCFPIGTVLGVFSIIVLARPGVRARFHTVP